MTVNRKHDELLAFAAFETNYDERRHAVAAWARESPMSRARYTREAWGVVRKVREIESQKDAENK